jgi:hypothetical protein
MGCAWLAKADRALIIRGTGGAAHGRYAAVVAVGQFLQRSALLTPSGGLFLLRWCQRRGPSLVFSWGLGAAPAFGGAYGLDRAQHRQARPIPPASAARCGCQCRPTAPPVSGEGCCALADRCASRSPRRGGKPFEHTQKLATVGPASRSPSPADVPAAASGGPKLLKLALKGLPVGRYASIADEAFFGVAFRP